MRKFLTLVLIIVALFTATTFVIAQAEGITINGIDDSEFPILRLLVTVIGSDGRPVLGLTEADFEALAAGRDAEVVQVEEIRNAELAVSVVLVLDSSESMFGVPLDDQKAAANLLLDNLRPSDEVAVIDFDSEVRLAQPFTSDFAAARDVVNSATAGGVTALYQAVYDSVEVVLNEATNPRRVVVLVTDGHEFGGRSTRAAAEGINFANENGIPFFAIGFGSIYEPYLRSLGDGTGGRTYILPSSGQLEEAFDFISNFLRSQYLVTIAPDLEPDGSPAPITLRSGASSTSRGYVTPDLYPTPSIVDLPAQPIGEVTNTTVIGEAPRQFGQLDVAIDGETVTLENPAINGENTRIEGSVQIDPFALPPGEHTLTVTATDSLGGSRSTTQTFSVAELPLIFNVGGIDLGEIINQPGLRTVAADIVQTQGAIESVTFAVDSEVFETDREAPYSAEFNLQSLQPGTHILTLTARNIFGQESVQDIPFTIAEPPTPTPTNTPVPPSATPAPPTNTPVPPSATAVPPTATPVPLTNTPVPPTNTLVSPTSTVIPATVAAAVPTNTAVPAVIGGGPLVFTTRGIEQGEVVTSAARAVRVLLGEGVSAESVTFALDREEIDRDLAAPYIVTIPIGRLAAGTHVLDITVTGTAGEEGTTQIAFTVPEATPTAVRTPANVTAPVIATAVPLSLTIEGIDLGEVIAGGVRTVEVTLPEGAQVESIDFTLNGDEISTDTEAPYSVDIDTDALEPGAYILGIIATGAAGDTASEEVPFTIVEAAEEATITAEPTAAVETTEVPLTFTTAGITTGETIGGETRTIEVTFPDEVEVESVTFALDTEEISTDTEAPYTFEIDTSALTPGEHELEITATGVNGETASEAITFNVSAEAAAAPLTFSFANLTEGETVAESTRIVEVVPGDNVNASGVTFALDGVDVATDDAAPFTFEIDTSMLEAGVHTLTATMRSTDGVEVAESISFNVPARAAAPNDLLLIGGTTLLLLLLLASWLTAGRRMRRSTSR